jgi:hypothetical protein
VANRDILLPRDEVEGAPLLLQGKALPVHLLRAPDVLRQHGNVVLLERLDRH